MQVKFYYTFAIQIYTEIPFHEMSVTFFAIQKFRLFSAPQSDFSISYLTMLPLCYRVLHPLMFAETF